MLRCEREDHDETTSRRLGLIFEIALKSSHERTRKIESEARSLRARLKRFEKLLRIGDARAANITPVHYYHHWHRHYWYHGGYPIAGFWNYYRTDWPGRGNDVESTR